MIHLGDITQIKGSDAPVVDCVIGGSPCQDLSLAGKREGLAGARSGLYMEQIRIIKEMREADALHGNTDVDIRPRYMVWENVPGAFGTNGGKDFAAVIEEAIRVAEPEAPPVSVPEKGWSTSGCFYDAMGRWSVAWRVLDAQFWGTSDKPLPQRRRRIALVADFGGLSAPEILFVRKSLSGDIEPGEPKRKATARDVGEGAGGTVPVTMKIRSGVEVDSQGKKAGKGALIQTDKSGCLNTVQDQYLFQPTAVGFPLGFRPENVRCYEETATTLVNGTRPGFTTGVIQSTVYGISPYHSNAMKSDNPHSGIYEAETSRSLDAMNRGFPGCNQGGMAVVETTGPQFTVRRLTPLECERLQGFPDGWTDIGEWVDSKGKVHKEADSPRYKALGNSIALPPWKWVLKRLCACYERDATMASLFDGIGGFPYIWERLNGKGSCLWASEIEEFPMAVTKLRFGE